MGISDAILENEGMKKFLAKQFRKYMLEKKHLNGIYAYIGEDGAIKFDEFTENPNVTISNLKKQVYGL